MAYRELMKEGERRPPAFIEEKSNAEVLITMLIRGLNPGDNKKDRVDVDVAVNNGCFGLDVKIEVKEGNQKKTVWRYIIIELPSKIDRDKCHFRIEKGQFQLTLVKKKEPGGKRYTNWTLAMENNNNNVDLYKEPEDHLSKANAFDLQKDVFHPTVITINELDPKIATLSIVVREPP